MIGTIIRWLWRTGLRKCVRLTSFMVLLLVAYFCYLVVDRDIGYWIADLADSLSPFPIDPES